MLDRLRLAVAVAVAMAASVAATSFGAPTVPTTAPSTTPQAAAPALAPAPAAAAPAAPAAATAAAEIQVLNPGFEEPANGVRAPGWMPSQHYGPERNYEWAVDTAVAAEGKASYRIRRLSPQVFGLINQAVVVSAYAGKTLEMSAKLKTDEVGPEGWLLVVNVESRNAILEQVRSEPATGKQDWKRHSVRFKLPVDAYEVKLGVMLLDAGTGWVDDIKLRVVD